MRDGLAFTADGRTTYLKKDIILLVALLLVITTITIRCSSPTESGEDQAVIEDEGPFRIVSIEFVDTTVDSTDYILHWAGSATLPIEVFHYQKPGGCPEGIICYKSDWTFDSAFSPFCLDNASRCNHVEPLFFDAEIVMVDADGDTAGPYDVPHWCRATPDSSLPEFVDTTWSLSTDLTGSWYTNMDGDIEYGWMMLRVDGDSVYGAYETNRGHIAGTLTGHRFDYRWWEGVGKDMPYDSADPSSRGVGWFRVYDHEDTLIGPWRTDEHEVLQSDPYRGAVKYADTINNDLIPWLGDTLSPGWYRDSDSSDHLMFSVMREDGTIDFYCGYDSGVTMQLTHIIRRNRRGNHSVTIMHDYLPVQWILDSATIAVYPSSDTFDSHNALHYILGPEIEDTFSIDIYPSNLPMIIDSMESLSDRSFEGARAYLRHFSIADFNDIRQQVGITGENQLLHIVAASAFGTAATTVAMNSYRNSFNNGLTKARFTGIDKIMKYAVQAAASRLADLLGESIHPGLARPGEPTVMVLLCQGAASLGIFDTCHYMFFKQSNLGMCITYCLTSMKCYTNICMPQEFSAGAAMNVKEKRFDSE